MRDKLRAIVPFTVVCALLASCAQEEQEQAPATTSQVTATTTAPPPSVNDGPAPGPVGSFRMDGPAPIEGATYDSMPYELPLNPAGPQETMVRWVDGLGVSPTNATEGTVFVLGHAWGQAPLVFNPFSEYATAHVDLNTPETITGVEGREVRRYPTDTLNGARITMSDEAGNLREWEVDGTYLIDKYEAIDDPELLDGNIKNRIVLIACATDGAVDLEYNVIVIGHLT